MAGRKKNRLGYLAQRTKRRLISRVYRRLYRDSVPEISRSVLLAGTARSGTTWLAELIALQQPTRLMFEPFYPLKVPDYAGFDNFLYMRAEDRDPVLEAFCERVFTGQIRNLWIDNTVGVLRPKARIVKDVRTNLLLKWISCRYPELPLILLLRHPCSVVLSRMERGWTADQDIFEMMAQEKLVEDFLGKWRDVINNAESEEEKHAIVWSIHNAIPLAQFSDGGISVIKYEDFVSDTSRCLGELLNAIGWDFDDSLSSFFEQPSRTSSLSTALEGAEVANRRWETRLSSAQVDRILRVVDAFGLSHLYS
jgi:hypothetical protein